MNKWTRHPWPHDPWNRHHPPKMVFLKLKPEIDKTIIRKFWGMIFDRFSFNASFICQDENALACARYFYRLNPALFLTAFHAAKARKDSCFSASVPAYDPALMDQLEALITDAENT